MISLLPSTKLGNALTVLFTFVLTGGGASAHSTTTLSVGGCGNNHIVNVSSPNGQFNMGVCVTDHNTPPDIFSDVYVNAQPTGPFNCTLYIELWRDSGGKVYQDGGHPCTFGHYLSTITIMHPLPCTLFHTSAWISYSGTFYRIGDSPSYTYC
jgi:hypothetical protein